MMRAIAQIAKIKNKDRIIWIKLVLNLYNLSSH